MLLTRELSCAASLSEMPLGEVLAEESKNSLIDEDRVPVIIPPGDNLCSCKSCIFEPSTEKTLLNKNILNTTLLTASRKKLGICNYHQLDFGTILDLEKITMRVIKDIKYTVPKKLLNLPSTSQI